MDTADLLDLLRSSLATARAASLPPGCAGLLRRDAIRLVLEHLGELDHTCPALALLRVVEQDADSLFREREEAELGSREKRLAEQAVRAVAALEADGGASDETIAAWLARPECPDPIWIDDP